MDVERFKTVEGRVRCSLRIERSDFIATLEGVNSAEEAREFFSQVSSEFRDATHNCPAYRILSLNGLVEFSSDAGEPSGTAGLPILNVLRRYELLNVAVVVTRYFGGVKLGIRGLIDAYSSAMEKAVAEALDKKLVVVKKRAYKHKIKIDFVSYGKRIQQLHSAGATVLDVSYHEEYALVEVLAPKPLNLDEWPGIVSTETVYAP